MTQRIYRYEVPVDDQWHELGASGPILHVDCRKADTVDVWFTSTWEPFIRRRLRVYGAGHDVPEDARYVGTALSPTGPGPFSMPYGQLVWHVFEAEVG